MLEVEAGTEDEVEDEVEVVVAGSEGRTVVAVVSSPPHDAATRASTEMSIQRRITREAIGRVGLTDDRILFPALELTPQLCEATSPFLGNARPAFSRLMRPSRKR